MTWSRFRWKERTCGGSRAAGGAGKAEGPGAAGASGRDQKVTLADSQRRRPSSTAPLVERVKWLYSLA